MSTHDNTGRKVVNLSSRALTPDEIRILGLGLKYNHDDATNLDFLKHLETLINRPTFTAEAKSKCRLIATNMIRKHERIRLPESDRIALKSLKNDKDIVILPADKGGATVVMNRHEYVNKMKVILSDTQAYTRVQEDPTKKQITTLSKTIQKLAKNGVITPNLRTFLDPAETHCARAYGTPKIHKEEAPLRIIVSLIGSPTYKLSKWLFSKLKHLNRQSPYALMDAKAFINQIQRISMEPEECMVSFDVISLSPSIPSDLVRSLYNYYWRAS